MSVFLFIVLVLFLLVCLAAKLAGAGVRFTAWVLKACWMLFAFICLIKLITGGAWVGWGPFGFAGLLIRQEITTNPVSAETGSFYGFIFV